MIVCDKCKSSKVTDEPFGSARLCKPCIDEFNAWLNDRMSRSRTPRGVARGLALKLGKDGPFSANDLAVSMVAEGYEYDARTAYYALRKWPEFHLVGNSVFRLRSEVSK